MLHRNRFEHESINSLSITQTSLSLEMRCRPKHKETNARAFFLIAKKANTFRNKVWYRRMFDVSTNYDLVIESILVIETARKTPQKTTFRTKNTKQILLCYMWTSLTHALWRVRFVWRHFHVTNQIHIWHTFCWPNYKICWKAQCYSKVMILVLFLFCETLWF